MDDLISRQKAIYALKAKAVPLYKDPGCNDIWERDRTLDNAIDVIRGLPSADFGLDEWCTECKEYDQERHCCPRINRVIRETLKEAENDQWIPVSERLPERDGDYLVCFEKGYKEDYGFGDVGIAPFEVDCEGFGIWQENFDLYTLGSLGSEWVDIPVIAWMPLPEPYKEVDGG